jgi:hypothetical protein
MSLRVGVRIDYVCAPPSPSLRVALLINGAEAWIGAIPWLDLVRKGKFYHELRMGNDGPSRQRLKKASMQQEEETARALGGHRQTGSGARAGHKGDGRVFGRFRIENKFTTAKEFRLKLAELRKIRAECSNQEIPVFDVQFKERDTLKTIDHWALVPWSEWEKRANADAGKHK